MTESVIITAIIMLGMILSIGKTAVSDKAERAELMDVQAELKKEIGSLRKQISEGG